MAHIRIIDRPCGYGKSTLINRCFNKREKYIAVVPYLSEVSRFVSDARKNSGFILTEPTSSKGNKSDHCEKLIRAEKSIACTHALFYRLGTLATFQTGVASCPTFGENGSPVIKMKHLLTPYNLIIDEVVDPFELDSTVRRVDFDEDYLNDGLALELPDGRIEPTDLWDKKYQQGSRTFSSSLYEKAKSGGLYRLGEKLFVLTIPTELLLKPKSVTIYTYLSEGSLLLQFLKKLQIDRPEAFTLEVDRLSYQDEKEWRENVANALTVLSIPDVADKEWTHNAQLNRNKKHSECASTGHELRKFKDIELQGENLNSVMMTCARDLWHGNKSGQKPRAGRLAKHTRMFGRPLKVEVFNEDTEVYEDDWSTTGVRFVPNTTRGTNAHSNCTTAVYLYDQYPNPQLLTFLGMARSSDKAFQFCNAYALTELIQWLFRSAIRVGGLNSTKHPYTPRRKVTVYIPSQRMRNLLLNWLLSGQVHCGPVIPDGQRQEELLARLEGRNMAKAA
jgi:hypothetical protein